MRRLLKYLPPEQLNAVNLLLRQSNAKIDEAVKLQSSHLIQMTSVIPSSVASLDSEVAWLRYYRPTTGEDWFCSQFSDFGIRCLYYCGQFCIREYDPQLIRMKPGIILDMFWLPKTFYEVKQTHVCCEDQFHRRVNYIRLLREG